MAETKLLVGSATDVGRRRDHNEDAMTTFRASDGAQVLVVADGMGGHAAGEVASEIAIKVLSRDLSAHAYDPAEALRISIEAANREIWQESESDASKQGMGSTIVAAIVLQDKAYFANAGDSPAYLVRNGETEQITHDHGLVAEQVAAGVISSEDAEKHPFRHILTRCLGADEHVEVELYAPVVLQTSDTLVLCSDGLTEHVSKQEIAELSTSDDPNIIAKELIDLANSRGGHDNITVIVARVR